MKKHYPIYESNRNDPQTEKVFASLSNKNKIALKSFLEVCSIQSKSKKRTDNRRRALIRFFDFLEKDFDKITYDDYVATAKAVSESKLGVYARNTEKDFIKRFLKQNYKDAIERFDNFKLFKAEQKDEEDKLTDKQLLTSSDIEKLMAVTDDMKYKALIGVLYESAGRPEEVLKLRYSDVDFSQKLIYLFSVKTKKEKVCSG